MNFHIYIVRSRYVGDERVRIHAGSGRIAVRDLQAIADVLALATAQGQVRQGRIFLTFTTPT